MRTHKLLPLLLAALMLIGLLPVSASAADSGIYVLMNIPYAEFYAAELGAGDAAVDAVTSSTLNKPRTGTLAGGSYHKSTDGTDISGVIYPVKVSDESLLDGLTEITDASSVDITVTNRGKESTTTYSGPEALFEAPDHAYYRLSTAPALYKELSRSAGGFAFSAVSGKSSAVEGVVAEVTMGGRHTDVEISLTGTSVTDDTVVSGVILTDAAGAKYGLRHVYNIWRGTELGWNLGEYDLGGKTIKNIRYITKDSVTDYPVDFPLSDAGYVLMNIPYAKFYAAELGENGDADAVTSATKNKRSNGNLAAGSYHVGAEGEGIEGVTYPVFVPDLSVLDPTKEITDENSVEVTTTARGNTTTTVYNGPDALFEADSYCWYALSEKPARSKKLSVDEDGAFSFGAVSGRAASIEGVTAAVTYNGRHTDIEIVLEGTASEEGAGIAQGDPVSAVIVTTADGKQYGLGHVTNIWRSVQLGWNGDDVLNAGKDGYTITGIRYITKDAVIDYPVEITVLPRGEAGFTDIAEDAWYAAPAAWAVKNGVISNRGDGRFDAKARLTRADVVTYLWNAAGKPEPTIQNHFEDVSENDSFCKAVLWALENGLTDGTGEGLFSPEKEMNRATIVTLLWKAAGRPEAAATAPFSDVPENVWYRDAVLWAVEQGITEGTGNGMFSPLMTCTKGHIVTFLCRNAQ